MTTSQMSRVFPCSIEQLWTTVINLEDTAWRSDLDRVEPLSRNHFVEYTKAGYATFFTVTAQEPLHRWAFTMENDNLSGHWEGKFEAVGGGSQLSFTETITAKHWWMRPFVPGYLKRQQSLYLKDLQRKLEETTNKST